MLSFCFDKFACTLLHEISNFIMIHFFLLLYLTMLFTPDSLVCLYTLLSTLNHLNYLLWSKLSNVLML